MTAAKVCTGISGELIQANKTLADNTGLMSEDVSLFFNRSRVRFVHCATRVPRAVYHHACTEEQTAHDLWYLVVVNCAICYARIYRGICSSCCVWPRYTRRALSYRDTVRCSRNTMGAPNARRAVRRDIVDLPVRAVVCLVSVTLGMPVCITAADPFLSR